jgi:hypothetical protein
MTFTNSLPAVPTTVTTKAPAVPQDAPIALEPLGRIPGLTQAEVADLEQQRLRNLTARAVVTKLFTQKEASNG